MRRLRLRVLNTLLMVSLLVGLAAPAQANGDDTEPEDYFRIVSSTPEPGTRFEDNVPVYDVSVDVEYRLTQYDEVTLQVELHVPGEGGFGFEGVTVTKGSGIATLTGTVSSNNFDRFQGGSVILALSAYVPDPNPGNPNMLLFWDEYEDYVHYFTPREKEPPADLPRSPLTAAYQQGGIANLAWIVEEPDSNIVTYQVWRSSEPAAPQVVATVTSSVYEEVGMGQAFTYQDQELPAGSSYSYHVRGIDVIGNILYMTETQQVDAPALEIRDFQVDVNRAGNLAMPGSWVDLTLHAETNRAAAARVTYTTWLSELGEELSEPRITMSEVTIAESGPETGEYKGQFVLSEGMSEIVSIEGILEDSAEQRVSALAAGFPVQVAGVLHAQLLYNGNDPSLMEGASVLLLDSNGNVIQNQKVRGQGEYPFAGLTPDASYDLRVDYYGTVLAEYQGLRIKSGMTVEQVIPVDALAHIRVRALSPEQQPLAVEHFSLYGEDGAYLYRLRPFQDGGLWTAYSSAMKAGSAVHIVPDLRGLEYQPVTERVALKEGLQEHTIQLRPVGSATVKGKVTDERGTPVAGAKVEVVQTYNGKSARFSEVTNESGEYRISTKSVPAYIHVVPTRLYQTPGEQQLTLAEGEETSVDFVLKRIEGHFVNVELYTKYIGGNWQGPLPMNWQNAMNYRLLINGLSTFGENPFQIKGVTGERISICADGGHYGLSEDCQEMTLTDPEEVHTVQLRLEQEGSIIAGELFLPEHESLTGEWHMTLYQVGDGGSRRMIANIAEQLQKFQILVPELATGKYIVQFHYGSYMYEREIDATAGQTIHLGNITLVEQGLLAGRPDSGFSVSPKEVSLGGTLSFRASYRNVMEANMTGAVLLLDIPQGATLVDGSMSRTITRDGQTISSDEKGAVQGSVYRIPLGTIEPNESGMVSFQVEVGSAYDLANIGSTAQIHFTYAGNPYNEILGVASSGVIPISLDAPKVVSSPTVVLAGKAPVRELVKVYEGEQFLGETRASGNGLWRLEAVLPDQGVKTRHVVHAQSQVNGRALRSADAEMTVDDDYPVVTELSMSHVGLEEVVVRPEAGNVLHFPFTVNPTIPFFFQLKFSNPDRVRHVYVHMEGVADPVPAISNDEGVFEAQVSKYDMYTLGNISVSYDVVPNRAFPSPQTEAKLRAVLAPELQNFRVLSQDPIEVEEGDRQGSATFEFPEIDGELTTTVEIEDSNYEPTREDMARYERTGIPIFQPRMEMKMGDEGLEIIFKSYAVENESASAALAPVGKRNVVEIAALDWGKVKEITQTIIVADKAVREGNPGIQITKVLGDALGTYAHDNTYYDRINQLSAQMGACVSVAQQGKGAFYAQELAEASNLALAADVTKWAVKLGGLFVAEGTLMLGYFLAEQTTNFLNGQIDSVVDREIARIQKQLTDDGCEDIETEKKKFQYLINPKWKYDPSGYVYEAVPGNRLSGVTATVMYRENGTGPWNVWDEAEAYGEINPQVTDREGRYGWDVPRGVWQVLYEKDGYLTARSAELTVPPPHFDVNIAMVSLEAPQVTSLEYSAKEQGVVVEFSKPIQASLIAAGMMRVMDAAYVPVAGAVEALEAEYDSGGNPLTRKVLFRPLAELVRGETYGVEIVSAYAVSYAGTPMAADFRSTMVVPVTAPQGPVLQAARLGTSGDLITLVFDKELDVRSAVAGRLALSGSSAAVERVIGDAGDPKRLLVVLRGRIGAGDPVAVSVMEDAVRDRAGNASAAVEIAVSNPLLSANADLRSLAVLPGTLEPGFDAGVLSYRVAVDLDTASVDVSAAAADGKAELKIYGDSALDSADAFKSVVLEGTETVIPIEVTAEDGTRKRYTVTVVREAKEPQPGDGDGGSGGGGGAGAGAGSSGDGRSLETVVAAERGGMIEADGIVIHIPAAALKECVRISVRRLSVLPAWRGIRGERAAADAMKLISGVYDIVKDKAGVFDKPVTITLTFDRIQADLDRYDIGIYWLDEAAGEWVKLDNVKVDGANGSVSGDVDHFTKFAVLAVPKAQSDLEETVGRLFTDVEGHWAEQAVGTLAQRGVMKGYEDGSFRPDQAITRAEFVTILTRTFGLGGSGRAELSFEDAKGHWAHEAIAAAVQSGIVEGYHDQVFGADDPITREQIAVIMARLGERKGVVPVPGGGAAGVDAAKRFNDQGALSPWAVDSVAAAAGAGLITGYPDRTFKPKANATRAETAAIMVKALELWGG